MGLLKHESLQSLAGRRLRRRELADMKGTELLTAIKETTPKMIKIIMTGYPSLQNAIETVNKGADAYMLKPLNMNDALRTIREHLKKQEQARKYSEQKVVEFIETRVIEFNKREPLCTKKALR